MMNIHTVESTARAVRKVSTALSAAPVVIRNEALTALMSRLQSGARKIIAANSKDLRAAREKGLAPVLIERLTLDERRIGQMIAGVGEIIALPDPTGKMLDRVDRPNGLVIEKVSVPLGVIGIIYESRPNVTIDASALCIKSGNAVVLRGGSEAFHSNRMLVSILKKALSDVGLPAQCVGFIDTTDRKAVLEMVAQDASIDVIIPRGSQKLISLIRQHATVPVIAHGEGNCHIYVDDDADLAMAEEIVFNAKVQRPSVCNAAEKLLVHASVAHRFLPRITSRLQSAGVTVKGDSAARRIVRSIVPVPASDWSREYLDLIIAVKIVHGVDEAIAHIARYGSHHSDAIVTSNEDHADRFLKHVDSAAVYVNASTRFTDGFEFGLGAEMGISTQKLHARGPMGLAELTTVKYIVRGTGQIRV
ncbi:MAG TPA: glutamate-5-semialdehyde dehydrogenase [Bacteroidota bacterium]|nr:glutamate-5-semialdehyde dehydrogenase [Bacteroidota bacterium]